MTIGEERPHQPIVRIPSIVTTMTIGTLFYIYNLRFIHRKVASSPTTSQKILTSLLVLPLSYPQTTFIIKQLYPITMPHWPLTKKGWAKMKLILRPDYNEWRVWVKEEKRKIAEEKEKYVPTHLPTATSSTNSYLACLLPIHI